jgi:hypothetical protein
MIPRANLFAFVRESWRTHLFDPGLLSLGILSSGFVVGEPACARGVRVCLCAVLARSR